jgi:hypothetical protein
MKRTQSLDTFNTGHSKSLGKQVETILARYGAPHDAFRRISYEMFLWQSLDNISVAIHYGDVSWMKETMDTMVAVIDKVRAESR